MIVAVLAFLTTSAFAGFATDCPTLEQQQASYDARNASKSTGTTSIQQAKDAQQQAKDAQQAAKDKQQADTDAWQIACDKRLKDFERTLVEREAKLKECPPCQRPCCKDVASNPPTQTVPKDGYICWKKSCNGGWEKTQDGKHWTANSKGTFIDGIPQDEYFKMKKEAKSKFPGDPFKCDTELARLKNEYKAKHGNRSGGLDNTNPGGGGNDNGTLNPHSINAR